MKRYALKTKTGEVIKTINAVDEENAVELFAEMKRMSNIALDKREIIIKNLSIGTNSIIPIIYLQHKNLKFSLQNYAEILFMFQMLHIFQSQKLQLLELLLEECKQKLALIERLYQKL